MIRMSTSKLTLAVAAALALGCASTSPKGAYDATASAIEDRLGQRVHWNQGTDEDNQVAARVHELLQKELDVNAAVQIALVNNPGLQATFEELRIAQADLVQAGLLKNPAFGGALLFPISNDSSESKAVTDVQVNVVADFLDVFAIPARKHIAESRLEAAKFRVGDAAIGLAYDVQSAFYSAQGAAQVLAMRRAVLDAGEAAMELARRQHDAGNTSDLDLANEQAVYEQLRLDVAQSEAELLSARESLTRLMGVWGADTEWKIAGKLPELPPSDPPLEHLESLAIARRFDLAAMHAEVQALSDSVAFVKNYRWLDTSIGAAVERTHEGLVIAGPSGTIVLPLFDQKQAVVAKLEGMMRQAQARETAMAIDIRSEVRIVRARVVLTRGLVERYTTVVVPLRERVVALSQQQYNSMLIGIYQVLIAKQNEIAAYRELIMAARDYWIARADLERSVAGRIVDPADPKSMSKPEEKPEDKPAEKKE